MAAAMVAIPTKPRRSVAFADDSSPPARRRLSERERLELMMRRQASLLANAMQARLATIVPFTEGCEERLERLGGWRGYGISFDHAPDVTVKDSFLLPNGGDTNCAVTVLDGILNKEMCQSFINVHEQVGFSALPSLLLGMASEKNIPEEEAVDDPLMQLAYQQQKNSSKLVQIESRDFANYLWANVKHHLPDRHCHVGTVTSGVFEKWGIVPTFRFMRYQTGQGFKPHRDPSRTFLEDPLAEAGASEANIFESMFTIALYLNDPSEFVGGALNFVKMEVDAAGSKQYKSQATVSPAVGRCVLFCHRELHEGGGVESGTKYMCQCDVLYRRVASLPEQESA